MNARTILTISALFAMPAVASAQVSAKAEAGARVEARHGASSGSQSEQKSAQSQAAGQAALRANAEARLPEAPVRRTIAEGEARGASRAQIDRAAMQTHTRLKVARESLENEGERAPSDSEVTAGAEALASGATSADLRTLSQQAPEGRSLTASLHALAELSGNGVESASAASTIAARLAAGANDQAIASLAASASSVAGMGASGAGAGAQGALGAGAAAGGLLGGASGAVNATVGAAASIGGAIR